jgi:cysteinyl-tRNA synthetase
MLKLFNTLGRRIEIFYPVNRKVVNIFTCGPSVYQRAHIGNFRTFLFEDILARYLEYSGYKVRRGMNLTDIEDKALKEADKQKTTIKSLTRKNIEVFIREMKLLRMKMPDYLPKASESINESVEIINQLLSEKIAYRHDRNIYFDPLKFPGFGKLYGLDMSLWPKKKRRFHKDTYPGMLWNLGDFILWHGYKKEDKYYWDTKIGRGRPSWNIQDPSMISKHFHETLSIYCGGIDNLYRHHDYTRAILESVRPYPMARFWLHCNHLYVNGQKMSKSKGNIIYNETLQRHGYNMTEIRFLLTYKHYRDKLNYSEEVMRLNVNRLRSFKTLIKTVRRKALKKTYLKVGISRELGERFIFNMDNDLDVEGAFNDLHGALSNMNIDKLKPHEASDIIATLMEIDRVLGVIF